MDNNAINNNIEKKLQETSVVKEKTRPDEHSGIHVQGYVKIYDPETQEVFVNGRA